jgi:hypothetical protein
MHVDRSSLQLVAVLRLPLPSTDNLTRLVYNPNRETRKLKETRKGSMKWRWSTWWREESAKRRD